MCWFRRPYCLRRRSASVQLLGKRVRIPLRAWMFVYCVPCVGSGLWDELISRSGDFYRVCVCVCVSNCVCVCVCVCVCLCLIVCDLETSAVRWPCSQLGCCATEKKLLYSFNYSHILSIIVQQDATMYSLLYFCKLLYIFRVITPSIIRSTYNCNCSICYWTNFGKCSVVKSAKDERYGPYRLCYLPRSYARIR
jgi:hypothetical protein